MYPNLGKKNDDEPPVAYNHVNNTVFMQPPATYEL